MTTRTSTGKGLSKPHKAEKPVPGIGSNLANAKSIDTQKSSNKKVGSGGVANTYYANSRACNGEGEK